MAPLQRPGTETLKTSKTCHPVGGPNYSTANSKSKLPKQSSGFDLGVSKTNIMTQQRLRKLHFFPIAITQQKLLLLQIIPLGVGV